MSYVFIVNKTKGSNLGNADVADSFFSRFKGLMMVKNLERGLILNYLLIEVEELQVYICFSCEYL
jgi:uncharacterized membrane protein (UPF0127 family)